jgi:hypothetical protein
MFAIPEFVEDNTVAKSTEVMLNWNLDSLVLSDPARYRYEVRYKASSSKSWKTLSAYFMSKMFVRDLQEDTSYDFQIRLRNNNIDCSGDWSSTY